MSSVVAPKPSPSLRQRAHGTSWSAPSISIEARVLWVAVLIFLLAIAWWLSQDNRIPEWDSGWHMQEAIQDNAWLLNGPLSAPFTSYDQYPQLVQLIGAIAVFIFGKHPMALVMVACVVFVPLFAFGCYGVGRIAAGNRAGLLAGIVGLGIPIFASLSHTFDLDTPEAAMVAVSLWGILASRRFERPGVSALAGFLCGAATLTKQSSVVFLAGPFLVVLFRGGWRNWRGLVLFALLAGVVAGPWYVYHLSDIIQTFNGRSQVVPNSPAAPPRWSLTNIEWYFWALVNLQVLVPLTLFFIVGVVIALRRCWPGVGPRGVLPELLVGTIVSYLGMTYLQKDPRYTVPMLVYVAVLSTFWIVKIPAKRLRRVATTAVVAVALINFESMIFGLGGVHRAMLALPGAQSSMVYPYQLTLYENIGWLRGPPQDDVDVRALFRGLVRAGFTDVAFDPGAGDLDFNFLGGDPVAESQGLNVVPPSTPPTPKEAYLLTHTPRSGDPPPCRTLRDGAGIYIISGDSTGIDAASLRDPSSPGKRFSYFCPGGSAYLWP